MCHLKKLCYFDRWECNLAAVWAQMSTGGGHSKLQETMSVVGVPVMSKTSFISTERAIGEVWEQQLRETMLEAGREEKQLAIEKGNYHEGVPAITVIVDGGWSKRSHKHSYNAKSGVAIIIGKETGKLLFIGVRNKFCYACSRQIPKDKHDCFKNWNKSSSEMETDIILQGFIEAENVHGLRYTSFVGDGDSSVYSTLLQCVPEWGHAINKVECANHACKCYRGALEKLVKEHPSYKGSGGLTLKLRKRLVSSARCAIRMRSTEKDRNKALESLKKDIINGPHHCFGNHSNCSPDFCTTARDRLTQQSFQAEIITVTSSTCMTEEEKENEGESLSKKYISVSVIIIYAVDQGTMWSDTLEDDNPSVEKDIRQGELIPQNVDPKMFHDIQVILARLVGKAHQLIGNATTNLAECWMHIRSKFDGGKVINRSQSGSWDHRCMGAGLRQNLGPEWGPDVWRRVTQASPNKVFTDVTASITNSLAKDKKRKATGPAKEQRRKSKYLKLDDTPAARKAYDRHDDGISPDDTTADVSPAQLQIMVESYYERRVKVSEKRVKEIEGSTREQSDSDQWRQERRQRITASKVGSIAKMREITKKSKKLKKYCTLLSEAMRPHGTDH